MQQRNLLILLLIVLRTSGYAQNNDIGYAFNLGLSENKVNKNLVMDENFDTKPLLSGSFGFFFFHNISINSELGIEFLLLKMESVDDSTSPVYSYIPGLNSYFITGKVNEKDNFKFYYSAFPVFYRYKFRKFKFKLGFQPMIMNLGQHTKQRIEYTQFDSNKTDFKYRILNLRKFDCGPKIGIVYLISTKMRIQLEYYHGFLNISRYDDVISNRLNRQATLGLQYSLTTTNSISEK